MDQRRAQSPRMAPLPPEHTPELKEQFESMRKNLGLHSEQHPDHAAQAKTGESAGTDDRGDMGSRRQSRSRLQEDYRACGEPGCRLPILHGSHSRRCASLRRRGQEARGGLGLSDEPALQRRRTGDARFRAGGCVRSECRNGRDVCRSCANTGPKSKSSKSSALFRSSVS